MSNVGYESLLSAVFCLLGAVKEVGKREDWCRRSQARRARRAAPQTKHYHEHPTYSSNAVYDSTGQLQDCGVLRTAPSRPRAKGNGTLDAYINIS